MAGWAYGNSHEYGRRASIVVTVVTSVRPSVVLPVTGIRLDGKITLFADFGGKSYTYVSIPVPVSGGNVLVLRRNGLALPVNAHALTVPVILPIQSIPAERTGARAADEGRRKNVNNRENKGFLHFYLLSGILFNWVRTAPIGHYTLTRQKSQAH
jgi:hypothetical protein